MDLLRFERNFRIDALAVRIYLLAMMIDENSAWDAVMARDNSFDGRLFFAVTSTNIYCRPSCPARRPLRRNVRFFDRPHDAEVAGFRACLRCRPESVTAPGTALIATLRDLLDRHIEGGITLAELAEQTGMSPHHLQRTFKAAVGATPKEYLAARRAEKLKQSLKEGTMVTDASYDVGYGSSSRLYSQANARLGMTPATYRRGGQGMEIHFATASTSLGTLLVAMTPRGVCMVSLGDDAASLEAALTAEFPRAEIDQIANAELGDALRAIVVQLEEGKPAADLPLDLQATSFQLRVWTALRAIPFGERRSYAEVAAAIGAPQSVRAVANACAHNRVAIVVPCHRVVRSDGETGEYRWGARRKEQILEGERLTVMLNVER